jgi:hypothetical protein
MQNNTSNDNELNRKQEYDPPRVLSRDQLQVELQTGTLPDEPPPPL